ncbi:MAG TPA: M20/M25/M40 family metallo-hydrolase [Fimbriimonas sp.]|nr:M20/M25/M40 family metallo-hydrolase [Fimbriimonas sp.]
MTTLAYALFAATYLDKVDAPDLKRHVTYLASDELGGRGTPSPGLDKAADYIADEFKKVGVLPGNGDSYFQVTEWTGRTDKGAKVRNVIGLIRGSDPELAKTYVVVSAHYDHLGTRPDAPGDDKIYNGANDDASGVSGMIEIAEALQTAKPKRSVVFIGWYGEEHGMVGSRYYVSKPVFPLKDTVANINLEQIGRTDDTEGARVSAISMTGFEFSSIGKTFGKIGAEMSVPVTGHPTNSGRYFFASDNVSFARAGIPAHTLCTAFQFPDYHQLKDTADKLDYSNMEKIVRMAAAGVLDIANNAKAPEWDRSQKAVEKYVEASDKLKAGGK